MLYAFLISPICATYPAHFILLDMIILMRFGKAYKLQTCLIYIVLVTKSVNDILTSRITCLTSRCMHTSLLWHLRPLLVDPGNATAAAASSCELVVLTHRTTGPKCLTCRISLQRTENFIYVWAWCPLIALRDCQSKNKLLTLTWDVRSEFVRDLHIMWSEQCIHQTKPVWSEFVFP
jgi:hypothetical protein